MRKYILFLAASLLLGNSLFGMRFFDLGRKPQEFFRFSASYQFYTYQKVLSDDKSHYIDLDDERYNDWYYSRYKYQFGLGIYLTDLLRIQIDLPFIYQKRLEYEYDGKADYDAGHGLQNVTLGMKYKFFDSGAVIPLKAITYGLGVKLDTGTDQMRIDGITAARNEIKNDFSFGGWLFPKKVSSFLNKNLGWQISFQHTFRGRIRSSITNYSRIGQKQGNVLKMSLGLSQGINKYFKIRTGVAFQKNMLSKEDKVLIVEELLDEEEDPMGISMKIGIQWRPIGKGRFEIAMDNGFPLKVSTSSYLSYWNPRFKLTIGF